jgi:DNA repair photolyase
MRAIGESTNRAREYNIYSCNTFWGCGHACNYNKNGGCYAAAMAVRFGWFKSIEDFQNNPRPKEGIIEALKKDAKRLSKKDPGAFVLLSFMTDAYQPINKEHQLTRQAIETLHGEGLGVNILTKGVITDFDLLAKNPHLSKVGVTYTGGDHPVYEKGSKPAYIRNRNITRAKEAGIPTWVSIEPVINPNRVLNYIMNMRNSVDKFKIGKWNYSPEAKKIDWYKFGHEVEALCQKLGVKYYIKEDLRKEMQ